MQAKNAIAAALSKQDNKCRVLVGIIQHLSTSLPEAVYDPTGKYIVSLAHVGVDDVEEVEAVTASRTKQQSVTIAKPTEAFLPAVVKTDLATDHPLLLSMLLGPGFGDALPPVDATAAVEVAVAATGEYKCLAAGTYSHMR